MTPQEKNRFIYGLFNRINRSNDSDGFVKIVGRGAILRCYHSVVKRGGTTRQRNDGNM